MFSAHSNLIKHEKLPELCIICHETPEKMIIPVELWSPAIGKFSIEINSYKSSSFTPSFNDVQTVLPLIQKLCKRFKKETEHTKVFKDLMKVYMENIKKPSNMNSKESNSKIVPDLALFSKFHTPEIIVEDKKGHQGTNADPLVEAICYYRHYCCVDENNSVNPCLLLVLEASTLIIYACVTNYEYKFVNDVAEYGKSNYICSRPLFTFDFAIQEANFEHATNVCRILKCIADTCEEIQVEKSFEHIDVGYYPLTLLGHYNEMDKSGIGKLNDKLVYINGTLVWKYCKNYGFDGHNAAAELGIAPNILGVYDVCGDWKLIKMEKIDGVTLHDSGYHDLDAWNEFVQKVHESNEKFVHGDIRYPNIIHSTDGKYYLIDFDWCSSIENTILYPHSINSEVFLGEDESIAPCLPILVEHDKLQLKHLNEDINNWIRNQTN